MNELAYVLITPYSLHKSRTGGIISRVLSLTNLELCAVKMYSPSQALVKEYMAALEKTPYTGRTKRLLLDYVEENLGPNTSQERSNRFMLLVLKGKNAVKQLNRTIIGPIAPDTAGDTVRGCYGDYLVRNGKVTFFEPSVISAADRASARRHLQIFKKYGKRDGGVITDLLPKCKHDKRDQTALVMLKPDNFLKPSSRPGDIIDMLAKTGLRIVGARLVAFTPAQANEFYGPLKKVFEAKLVNLVANRVRRSLRPALPFEIEPDEIQKIANIFRKKNAEYEFNRIVNYITGLAPDEINARNYDKPGKARCLVLLYHGPDAIVKIRKKLGPTNPADAKGGTVRGDYGANILVNSIHASDSPRNAMRERKITGLLGHEPSHLAAIIK